MPTPAPKPKKQSKKRSSGIKITNPDKWFSLCVRERANWTCEACGKRYEPEFTDDGLPKNQGLHASHYIGRSNYAVRFDPLNVDAHCYGCHSKFESNPHLFREWKLSRLGQEKYDILIEKSNDLMLGKQARKSKNEIAFHFKVEFEMMLLRKSSGIKKTGFQGYF